MSLGTLFIVNKSGGVIYTRDVSPVPRLPANEYLRLGSTFASLHTIAKQLSPLPGSGGIAVVDAAAFSLHCLETPTGLKFFVTAIPRGGAGAGAAAAQQQQQRPAAPAVAAFLFAVYRLYADYALKSPFCASRTRAREQARERARGIWPQRATLACKLRAGSRTVVCGRVSAVLAHCRMHAAVTVAVAHLSLTTTTPRPAPYFASRRRDRHADPHAPVRPRR
jgi:hypothetical protein